MLFVLIYLYLSLKLCAHFAYKSMLYLVSSCQCFKLFWRLGRDDPFPTVESARTRRTGYCEPPRHDPGVVLESAV